MSQPIKLNLKIYQGATFRETLRWESSTKVYKPISAITKSAPVVITAPSHGIPPGWRARVTNVAGMKEINSAAESYYIVTDTTTDTVIINSINALNFSDYTSGGVLEYNAPVDLTGYTGRMQIRPKLESPEILLELTSANNRIVIDETNSTISLVISPDVTSELNFTSAVYSMELVNGADVIPFVNGSVTLVKEVTR